MTSIGAELDREYANRNQPTQEDTMAPLPIIEAIERDLDASGHPDVVGAIHAVLVSHLTPRNMLAHVAAYIGALQDNPVVAAVEANPLSLDAAQMVAGWVEDAHHLAQGAPAQPA